MAPSPPVFILMSQLNDFARSFLFFLPGSSHLPVVVNGYERVQRQKEKRGYSENQPYNIIEINTQRA